MMRQKKTNRDLVVEVATSLFLNKGYLATSMDEIVATSKVSKTNIYYYFSSKEDLLSAILDQLIQTYRGLIAEIASQHALSVYERITALLQLLANQELSCLGGCPFLTLYTQLPPDAHAIRAKVGRFFLDQVDTVDKLLQMGIERQEFKAGLPSRPTAQLIVSAVEGGLFLQHAGQDDTLLEQALSTLALLLK